jgi:hypothetical protein
MGGLDEANAAIGVALLHIEDAATRDLLSIVQMTREHEQKIRKPVHIFQSLRVDRLR